MRVLIRPAMPEDARAIATIAAATKLASIDADSPRARKILSENRTFVATAQSEVIGFVDGFITLDGGGNRRFELDLLAVAPAAQGRGVGGRLTAACVAAAVAGGARQLRALVRCDNTTMHRFCRRQGFKRSARCFNLYVADAHAPMHRARRHAARLLPVDTLGYAGIWLEGSVSQEAIDSAHRLASQCGASLIGAVIPSSASAVADLLASNSFRHVSQYHWWTINLENGLA